MAPTNRNPAPGLQAADDEARRAELEHSISEKRQRAEALAGQREALAHEMASLRKDILCQEARLKVRICGAGVRRPCRIAWLSRALMPPPSALLES